LNRRRRAAGRQIVDLRRLNEAGSSSDGASELDIVSRNASVGLPEIEWDE
jgi:hypothetical protein